MKSIKFSFTIFIAFIFLCHYSFAQEPTIEWAINAKGKGDDRGFKIFVDNDENIIVTGRFHSKEITFGNITLVNSDTVNNTSDVFIVKYNKNGVVIWAKNYGGESDEFGSDCVSDINGNILIVFEYDSEIVAVENTVFKNNTKKGDGSDLAIIKLSSTGKVIWSKSFGGVKHEGGYASCALDKNNNVYLTGQFYSDKITLDSIELKNSKERGADVFLIKFNPSGKVIWAKSSQGQNTFDSSTQSCSVDNDGNIIISGIYGGSHIAFDKDAVIKNQNNTNKIFITKFSTDGKIVWLKDFNGSVVNTKLDYNNNIFLAGMFFDSTIVFENTILQNQGVADLFVAKLNSHGKLIWVNSAGGNSADGIRNFCIDSKGNTIITGSFNSTTLPFGRTILHKDTTNITLKKEERTEDIFIASYSKDGKVLWAKSAGGKGRNAGRSCSCGKNDNIYCTGSFDVSNLKLGKIILNNSGDSDLFILKLSKKSN